MPALPQSPADLPDVESPGLLSRRYLQDEFRARFDTENRLIRALGQRVDAVYLGDSLTAGCPFHLLLSDLYPLGLNRGVGGDCAEHLGLRLQADVVQLQPRMVTLMIGTNDIAHRFGYDDDDTLAANYQRQMSAILDVLAGTGADCFLGTIPPSIDIFLDRPMNDSQVRMQRRKAVLIPRLNDWLRTAAADRSMRLVDYHARLLDEAGQPIIGLYRDHCHFNDAGKLRMVQILREAVQPHASG